MNTKPIRYDLIDSRNGLVAGSYYDLKSADDAAKAYGSERCDVWPVYEWGG